MKSKYYKILSTPAWAYLVSICIALVLTVLPCIISGDILYWKELFTNLGYGVIASTLVSFMIDLGTTRRKQIQDKVMFTYMVADLKNECVELPSEMYNAVHGVYGYDDLGKYTFVEWTEKLFSILDVPNNQKRFVEIAYVLATITEIKRKSYELIEVMKLSLSNAFVTEDFIKSVKRLMNTCSRIERAQRDESYDYCKHLIIEELVPEIKIVFADISSDYDRKYNAEDYALL